MKKCQNLGTKILCPGDGPPAPPAHTGGTAKIHPKLSSFIYYIQVDCVLWSWIPTIPVLNPCRNANILYCLSPQSVHFAGFDAAAEKDLTYQVKILDAFNHFFISYQLCNGGHWSRYKHPQHLAKHPCVVMMTSIKSSSTWTSSFACILYMFSHQMSSFSENAALGYLKSQVCTW